ncbi:hypothetical protein ACJQWK_02423 [Exserohilum turcicum]
MRFAPTGLRSLSLAAVLTQAAVAAANPLQHKAAKAPVVNGTAPLHQGTVHGFVDAYGNSVFLGIPFAATTGGENRWQPPKDANKLKKGHVLDAAHYGPTCPQAMANPDYAPQGEDCLNLNIWVPPPRVQSQENAGLPVFVYMYGGAMVTGSSSDPRYIGTNFASSGVVFVSFNTRESTYAYPNSAELRDTKSNESQNFGILDVDKALQWVRDNIAQFGGDPDHVVFGGHSSGSVMVDYYLWNHPDTWLAGAVQMAANAKSGPAYAPTNQVLDIVAQEVQCPTGKGQLDCLRKVDMYALQTASFNASLNTYFTPVVDNITRFQDLEARFAAGKYASHVPLLTGNSNHEGSVFGFVYGSENTNFSQWIRTFDADIAEVPYSLVESAYNMSDYASVSAMSGAQYGDARFFCPVDHLLDLRSEKQDTWIYRFMAEYSNTIPLPAQVPTHGGEIPFYFGGKDVFSRAGVVNVTAEEQDLADYQHAWFVKWIKNPKASPGWAKATPKTGSLGLLGMRGNELQIEHGSTADYNARCQAIYNPYLPLYPVVQSIHAGGAQ